MRPSGESPEQLTHQHADVNFLAPLDLRTLLYVGRAEDWSGPWLWALDVESRVTRRVTVGLEQYTSVSASRDGSRVVATVAKPTAGLWRVPLHDRRIEDRDVQPYPVSTERALAPRFAGPSLFYLSLSTRGTGDGLWHGQNGQAFEVTRGADGVLSEPPAVSPDGSRVAVSRQAAGEKEPRGHVGRRHQLTNPRGVNRDPGCRGAKRGGLVARRDRGSSRVAETRRVRACS